MYHYRVTSHTGQVVLDSGRREDFEGYHSDGRAHMVALSAKLENRLDDLHVISTYPAVRVQEDKDLLSKQLARIKEILEA